MTSSIWFHIKDVWRPASTTAVDQAAPQQGSISSPQILKSYKNCSWHVLGLLLSGLTLGLLVPTAAHGATGTFRDEFSSVSYSNNDGSATWNGPWVETGDNGTPASGDVQIFNNSLFLDNDDTTPPILTRTANLTGADQAVLTFDFGVFDAAVVEASDQIVVEVSTNGTSNWVTLETFSGGVNGTRNFDISDFIGANTGVRFRIAQNYGGPNEFFIVDNVEITAVQSTPNSDFSNLCTADSTLDVLFILDDSGSVSATELEEQRLAVLDTLDYFISNGVTATAAITRFSSNSGLVIDYTPVTSSTRTSFDTALANNYGNTATGSGQLTNWEAGFQAGLNLGVNNPDTIFFFTDGTQNNGSSPIDEADALKQAGVHVYGVGIGPDVVLDDFRDVTDGPNTTQFNGTNITEADYVAITGFNTLRSEFAGFVNTLCVGSTLAGTVFLDQDSSGTFNAGDVGTDSAIVEVYRGDGNGNILDLNGDSVIDIGDAVATQETVNGTFGVSVVGTGQFILQVDTTTLPAGSTFTTNGNQNLILAVVDAPGGGTITGLDFGHINQLTIGDRIWYDLNQNRNQDPDEVGVRDVDLILSNGTCSSNGSTIDTTTTGVDGIYSFSVTPGTYCLEVDDASLPAPGWISTTANEPLDITVTDQNITDADIGYITTACLPRLDFETDAAGNSLSQGILISDQWAGWGIEVTTDNLNTPATLFNSSSPTGGDDDLGSPHIDLGGPGIGDGGGSGHPGVNAIAQGLTLIINERPDTSTPDDNANGGVLTFTFETPLRVDEVTILDTDVNRFNGTVTAFDSPTGGNVIASSPILAYGDNSFQSVPVGATNVRRLEITFETSGSVPSIDFCTDTPTSVGNVGDRIWRDLNQNGLQNTTDPGIANVVLELLIPGLNGVVTTTQTDANGSYQFSNLAPGTYNLRIANSNNTAALAGLTPSPTNVGSDDAIDSDFDENTGLAPVTIIGGNTNLSIDGGFFDPAVTNQSLLLVKRVTAINTDSIPTIVDGPGDADNDPQWPSTFLQGSIDTSVALPGDDIEYTIYFLSNGTANLSNVNLCDLIPTNTTYIPGSGQIAFGTTASAWTDVRDSDEGEFIAPNTTVTDTEVPGIGLCRNSDHTPGADFTSNENPNGAVWVKLDQLNSPITPGQTGYMRFRVRVNQTPSP